MRFYASVANHDLLSIGLNCATGPDLMTDHIRTLAEMSTTRISCYPNAGLPNEEDKYLETPEMLATQLDKFVEHGWLNIVGGCCGTTPAHIKAIAQMAEGRAPRKAPASSHRAYYSGIELVEAEDSNRPLIVGERTNVIGSRLFKSMIADEKWEEASEIARWQVKNGAHIIDVCLQSSDRDEIKDVAPFYAKLMPKIKVPVMIDTTDAAAMEQALTWCQGKSIINSINLEDGEEKFERICPVARAYGAALVVGTIDEDKLQAQAFTRERKLAVAERSVKLLTEKYGIEPEDIIIDPLVFPCATGDENYIGGAVETIEAIRLIKEQIPYVKTILGVSNISFGLPAEAREVVNSVFLYYATKAGLDLAIVNAQKLERFASIPMEERRLAENLLFNTPPPEIHAPEDWREQSKEQRAAINQFHIAAIAEHFRKAGKKVKKKAAELPLDERLANYIIEGTKDGLIADLDRKRAEGAGALAIINGPLMTGMTEVGRLFNNNELIVAEVLQSAEAMKAAVNHLEQFMEKTESSTRGKIVLATVKGDVHDIGKNLVEIILSNNGYQVINLGIKVPPEDLIRAWREHKPDAIGLSGLLVKSAHQMVTTASDFKDHGVEVPLLGRRRRAVGTFHHHAHRPRLFVADILRERRDDRPQHYERTDGPGHARDRHQHAYFHHRRRAARRSRARDQHGDHAQPEGPHRYSNPRRAVSRPPRARRSEPGRTVELHESIHALRPPSGLQGKFRKVAGRPRSESPRTVQRRGAREAGSREVPESPRGVALLRSGARRQLHQPL